MTYNTYIDLRVKAREGTYLKINWEDKEDNSKSEYLEFDKRFSVLFIEIYADEASNNEISSGEKKSDYWKIKLKEAIRTEQGNSQEFWFVFKNDIELLGSKPNQIEKTRLSNEQLILLLLMFVFAIIIFIYLIIRFSL